MYTAVIVDGIDYCPNCEKPTSCHGKEPEQRALYWALSGDTGISSSAIAQHMTGSGKRQMQPPSDADDRGRCIRLLEIIPEWIDRLPEMVKYDQNNHGGIVINNSGIGPNTNTWEKQIPLIIKEGNFNATN